jgi:diamine N-acetyltransferase
MMPTSPQVDQPLCIITGEKVALGPFRRDLMPLYYKWFNDPEVSRTRISTIRPLTWEAQEAWYNRISKEEGIGTVFFTLYERDTMRPIGETHLFDTDFFSRSAEYGINIGEKECWGKGYGTEATKLMLDYGFTVLCLHSIRLRTVSFNERGIRAYTAAGFKMAGRWREAYMFAGCAHDIVLMDCLATEFQSPVLRDRLQPP